MNQGPSKAVAVAPSREPREPRELKIPNEKAIAMIEACVTDLVKAATIPDVVRVMTEADAILMLMKKFQASEALQKAALALCVEAEIQLGKLSKALPTARGPVRAGTSAPKTKTQTLKDAGIKPARARVAEKLAVIPPPLVKEAIAQKSTLHGVTAGLGLLPQFQSEKRAEKKVRDLVFLAVEAIDLLERLVREPVYQGAVREFRKRLKDLSTDLDLA